MGVGGREGGGRPGASHSAERIGEEGEEEGMVVKERRKREVNRLQRQDFDLICYFFIYFFY